ncbi:CDP-alcohol phosphatidyltransferase family protein, partial [Dolichospermum sp. ST_sed10]|nr:CDP-alcohol phosphatidyltransferase family protein [Dolichospermum sp. ST_sed10]
DLYDGKLARKRREVTKFGKFLDPLADKILVIGALIQFGAMGLVNLWLVSVIVVRDIWVTYMRVMAIKNGTEMKTSGDAKIKTTIQLTVVINIILFTCIRLIVMHMGYTGSWIDHSRYLLFCNILLSVAVVFTIYSWFRYMKRIHPMKA